MPEWMLELKGANNKDWKKLEKKPNKRKTISTDIAKNTNKRFNKLLMKKAKKLKKLKQNDLDEGDDDNQLQEVTSEQQDEADYEFD